MSTTITEERQGELTTKFIQLLADIYEKAPKEHNRYEYPNEFESRLRASSNTNNIKEFVSTLVRKTNSKNINSGLGFGEWLHSLQCNEEQYLLNLVRKQSTYLILEIRENNYLKYQNKKRGE